MINPSRRLRFIQDPAILRGNRTSVTYGNTHLPQNFAGSVVFPDVNNSRNVSFLKEETRRGVYLRRELKEKETNLREV